MDRNEIIQAHFDATGGDGNHYFKRGQFRIHYRGDNQLGDHDDFIDCSFYEHFANENVYSSNFNEPLLKYVLTPQLQAHVFPFSKSDPDVIHDLNEHGPDELSSSIWIWDQKADDLEIDLRPIYTLSKAIFVFSRWTETVSIHEAHFLVETIPL